MKKLILLIAIIQMNGCIKDISDASKINGVKYDGLDGEYAIPIVKSSIGLTDLIFNRNEKKYLITKNGFLTARFDTVSYSLDVASLIVIPTLNISPPVQTFNIPNSFASAPIGTPFTVLSNQEVNETFTNTENFELDEISFEQGNLKISITNSSTHSTDFTLVFPDLKNINGQALTINKTVVGSTLDESVNLANYTLDYTNGNTTFNNLKVKISAVLTKTDYSVGPTNFGFSYTISNSKYKRIKGYFGDNRTFSPIVASLPIDFFKNNPVNGEITLSNPIIQINLSNDFQLPIKVDLLNNLFKATYNDQSTQNISGLPFPLLLDGAPLPNQAYNTEKICNAIAPNIGEVIKKNPIKLDFELISFFNPNGKTANRNIIRNTDKILVSTILELPLELKANGFVLEQFIEANIKDISNADSIIDKVEMRLALSSTLPIDNILQIEIIDPTSKLPIYKLLPDNTLLLKGAIDGVAQPNTPTIITISGKDWKDWAAKGVKELKLTHRLSTSGGGAQMVKLIEQQKIDVTMGAKVYLKARN